MQRIYKYVLQVAAYQELKLDEDAKVLSVQVQHGKICMWSIVPMRMNAQLHESKRRIHMVGTGHPMPDVENLVYIGTVQLEEGYLVLHVFMENLRSA